MQLTTPQPPQADDFEALRNDLNGFNETVTGQLLRERIASFIKDEDGAVFWGRLNGAGSISKGSGSMTPSAAMARRHGAVCPEKWHISYLPKTFNA